VLLWTGLLLAMTVLGEFLALWQIAGGCPLLAGIYRVNSRANKRVLNKDDALLETERNLDAQPVD